MSDDRATERAVWLEGGAEPIFAFVHAPAPTTRVDTAVIICPPFGWDEMSTHRVRRNWARRLVEAGLPTVRIDLPGSGESGGGPRSPDRLPAWKDAVLTAADWTRSTFSVSRIAVIGIGIGGMVATAAAADRPGIDELILWGVPSKGRRLLRELRAHAAAVARQDNDLTTLTPPGGGLEVTGFFFSGETLAALEGLDLAALSYSTAGAQRALLLGRDRLGIDDALRASLVAADVEVDVRECDDYHVLMAHPQEGVTPEATIEASVAWLADGLQRPRPSATAPAPPPVAASAVVELIVPDGRVREEAIELAGPSGVVRGVLTRPAQAPALPVCALLVNAGALRRIGPNRMWVELARRWAARGVPTVRIDFAGIGDSDGEESALRTNDRLYSDRMVHQAVEVIDGLAGLGLPEQFITVGLCSGAYWALHAALQDERVIAAQMLNLYSFYWSPELVSERDRRETAQALRSGLIKRIREGRLSWYHVRRALRSLRGQFWIRGRLLNRGGVERGLTQSVTDALDMLRDRGCDLLFELANDEPLYDQFVREGRLENLHLWPNMHVDLLESRDHMLRAGWLQRLLHERMDGHLEALLARRGLRAPAEPEPSYAGDAVLGAVAHGD